MRQKRRKRKKNAVKKMIHKNEKVYKWFSLIKIIYLRYLNKRGLQMVE